MATWVLHINVRHFKHETYVSIYKGGALTNVINRRIGFKLHQVRLKILILSCMTEHMSICFVGVYDKA